MSFLPYMGKLECEKLFYVVLPVLKEYLPKLVGREIDLSTEGFELMLKKAIVEEIEDMESQDKRFSYNEKQMARASLACLENWNNWDDMFAHIMREQILSQDEKLEGIAERAVQITLDYFGEKLDLAEKKILTGLIKTKLHGRVKAIQGEVGQEPGVAY